MFRWCRVDSEQSFLFHSVVRELLLKLGREKCSCSNCAKKRVQFGYIAQWLEQLTAVQQVPDSNPCVTSLTRGLGVRLHNSEVAIRCSTSTNLASTNYAVLAIMFRWCRVVSEQSFLFHSVVRELLLQLGRENSSCSNFAKKRKIRAIWST